MRSAIYQELEWIHFKYIFNWTWVHGHMLLLVCFPLFSFYFSIQHRGERRGLGGIFFDDLNDYDQEMLLSFATGDCMHYKFDVSHWKKSNCHYLMLLKQW